MAPELRYGATDSSKVALSHVREQWVCSNHDISNRYGHIKGDFAARVLMWV